MHAYTLLADIVGFTDATPEDQGEWARQFLSALRLAIEESARGAEVTVQSTGDGALLSICENAAQPSPERAIAPLDIARKLLRLNYGTSFPLRVGISYGPSDGYVGCPGPPGFPARMQVGNGLALAGRIIHFAEPNEIVLTGDYWRLLHEHVPERRRDLRTYRDVFVKNVGAVQLWAYKPRADEQRYIHWPPPDERTYNRYAFFPPLLPETVERFRELKLRRDLGNLCAYAYETIEALNARMIFISWEDIYSVLENMPTADGDDVLVLSRADLAEDFWSTDRARAYLEHLARPDTPTLEPQRLFVYDRGSRKPVVEPAVLDGLRRVHGPNSLEKIDVAHVRSNPLFPYRFGVTVFPRLGCAVAPIPFAASYGEYLQIIRYGDTEEAFERFRGANFSRTPFRALIIADREEAEMLAEAFAELRRGPTEPVP